MGRSTRGRVALGSVVVTAVVAAVIGSFGTVGGAGTRSVVATVGVSGKVLDATTFPTVGVDNVTVCLASPGGTTCAVSDASGGFAITGVAAGPYTLTATPPPGTAYLLVGGSGAYLPVPEVPVDLTGGSQVQDVHLLKGGRLEVALRQPDGATPAAGLPVTICRTDDTGPGACPDGVVLPVTDATGRTASPPLLPGIYRVAAGADTPVVGAAVVDDVVVDPDDVTLVQATLLDRAAPIVTGAPDRVPDRNGWYRGPVTITWTTVDPAPSSGLASTPGPSTVGSEGVNTYLSDDAVDNAGNRAFGQLAVRIDSIAPTVTCPADLHFTRNEPDATVRATVEDGTSGPAAAEVSAPVDTSVSGAGSVSLTGSDVAGNLTTVSCAYVVDAPSEYSFTGFSWPIGNDRINVVKAGRNVPVVWRITDASGRGVTGNTSFVSLTSSTIACPALRSGNVDVTLPFAIRPSHVGAGFWIGTWRAPSAVPGSCVEMRLALDDGSVHTAVFRVVR